MHKKTKKTLIAILSAFGLAFGGALAAGGALAQDGGLIDEDAARRVALEHVPGATVDEAELEEDADPPVWDVDLTASDGVEHELEIDARDGSVISAEVDDEEDED